MLLTCLGRQVIEGPDDTASFPVAPVGVARLPVFDVCRILVARRRVIEAGVGQKVLGTVRAAANPVGTVSELQIVLADILQPAPLQIARCLARRAAPISNVPDWPSKLDWLSSVRVERDGHAVPGAERSLKRPPARFIRREPHAPHVPLAAAMSVAIEEAGHIELPARRARQLYLQAVIEKRIGMVILLRWPSGRGS